MTGEDGFDEILSEDCFGGAPANVACGLAQLGTNVAFAGRLGNDVIGNQFIDLLLENSKKIEPLGFDLPSNLIARSTRISSLVSLSIPTDFTEST